MENQEKILLFWSGGKKSALALYQLQKNPFLKVVGLVSILDKTKNHVPYHGLPDSILIQQSKLLNLPLQRIYIDSVVGAKEEINKFLGLYEKKGIQKVAFGGADPFALNLKNSLYPLRDLKSHDLVELFFTSNHKAMVTSVDLNKLNAEHLSFEYTREYISKLPAEIDPFSANNEFHTFVTFGPHFKTRVPFSKAIAVNEDQYLVSLVKEP